MTLTPERLAEIRALADQLTESAYDAGRGQGMLQVLLDELDTVRRERDDAHRRVMEFTGAPTVDEAFQVIATPVEWDAIASLHDVLILPSADDEGHPFVLCDDCGTHSLDDNTDVCANQLCSTNRLPR